jgi:transcriptional regulator with XRE-family HTH domain
VDTDAEHGNGTGLPVREVTVNQVAAWNIARFRRAASLTQEQLGARIGWSGASVSEAERSWDGKRTREFDAQSLTVLALALGIPVIGLFLPPEDDGITVRYVITGGRGTRYGMGDYMILAVTPDGDDETPVFETYRERYGTAANRYLEPEWAAAVGRWLRRIWSPARRADLAARLRDRQRRLREDAAEMGQLADAITAGEEE